MKKVLALLLVSILLFTITGCENNENENNNSTTIQAINNDVSDYSSNDDDTKVIDDKESDLKNIAMSLLSAEDYENFLEQYFLSNNNWQLERNDENEKEYYDGESGYFDIGLYVDSCSIQSNGYALGIETPEILFEASYYSAQSLDFSIYVDSGISMEHCATFALKVFENSQAKITVDDFLMHYNGGEEIDASKIAKKTMIIKGVKYIVEVNPTYSLDGEVVDTHYSINVSFENR